METDMSPLGLDRLAAAESVLSDEQSAPRSFVETDRNVATCSRTIDFETAVKTDWDVTVIGAGPAGALAARQIGLSGLKTLLIDKCAFPRAKVCGGCISGLGRQVLARVGLQRLVEEPAASPLTRFHLATGGRHASLALPLGAAISRYQFDAALVHEAVAAGVEFLPETTAQVRGLVDTCRRRTVSLQDSVHEPMRTRSRLVLMADGLGRTSMRRHGPFAPRIASASRVGLSTTLAAADSDLRPGVVSMCVGREGYVGLVRVPDATINLAAAVDPEALRQRGPADVVRTILVQAGVEPPHSLDRVDWRGTGLLTRYSPRVAAKRLLLLGDAAGYVEPFTGEGMTWAMLAAASVAPLAKEWLGARQEERRACAQLANVWSRQHRSLLARRQRNCRSLAYLLRHPSAVRTAVGIMALAPAIAQPLIRHFWNQKDRP
jgi:flavin-dependent dehydrogenase